MTKTDNSLAFKDGCKLVRHATVALLPALEHKSSKKLSGQTIKFKALGVNTPGQDTERESVSYSNKGHSHSRKLTRTSGTKLPLTARPIQIQADEVNHIDQD